MSTYPFRLIAALALAALPLTAAAQTTGPIIPLPLRPLIPAEWRGCTQTTPSGLGYSELRAGSGARPVGDDYVLIDYIGYLATDGAVFDQGQRSAMGLGNVIEGFAEGLRLMPVGSIYRLCVPPALAYGDAGQGPIPAGSALVFQIELVDKRSLAELEAAQAQQGAPQQ